jgi:integrase
MLTDVVIRKTRPKAAKFYLADGRTGLRLKVSPTGAKSFVLRREGKERTLGAWPGMSLAEARSLAAGKTVPSRVTLRALADDWKADWAATTGRHGRPRSKHSIHSATASINFLAPFLDRPADGIERSELTAHLRKARETKPVAAHRTASVLNQIYRHGIMLGWVQANPLEGVPLRLLGHRAKRRAIALSLGQARDLVRRFLADNEGNEHLAKAVVILMTGLRHGEAEQLKPGDIKDGLAHVALTKNGRPHDVPWPPILARVALPFTRTRVVFWTWCKANLGVSPHDLRRTHATLLGEHCGAAPHVIEAQLNHILQGVAAAYNLAKLMAERQVVVDELESLLTR